MNPPNLAFDFRVSAPLAWVAIAATIGVVIDRLWPMPLAFSLAFGIAGLIARLVVRAAPFVSSGFLLLTAVSLGAAYHRLRQGDVDGAVAKLATAEGTPVHFRGRLVAPVLRVPGSDDPLQTIPRPDAEKLLIDVQGQFNAGVMEPLVGRVVAYVPGRVSDIFPGDEIEIRGRLVTPRGPSNPGEFDGLQDLRDQCISAIVSVPATADAVTLVEHRWPASVLGWLGRLHAGCKRILEENLTVEPALATALLLGDGSGLSRPEWDKFLKSGVVHALAISGQHLVVLAAFLAVLRRVTFVRLTPATLGIVAILIGYALLTGGRPPAMRAAWVVVVLAAAVVLKRPSSPLNTLAVAWLGVLIVNPADIFQTGCQLSFLAVALLQWVVAPWLHRPTEIDPVVNLEEPTPWGGVLTSTGQTIGSVYLANAVIWLGVTPLIAERFHVVAPVALLIGPPVVLATSIALVSGFLLLLAAPVVGPFALPLAWVTDGSLFACDSIITWGLKLPGASFTVTDVPNLWLFVFYAGVLATLIAPSFANRWAAALGAVWLLLGLAFGLGWLHRGEFRIAFLSVGHGGCTVIETSSGKVLVYDAGAMTGSEVTRRSIAPYLWSRGLRRIDDLFLSHADLDHFNGVPDLADRFPISRVTLTPSFADRKTPGVRQVMAELQKRGIPTRVIKAGDSDQVDDIKFDILHPPTFGPEGKENVRSLVMLLRREALAVLLTGDLEEAGLDQVLRLRPPGIDIMMAPHHGSRLANPAALANWGKPRLAISSQGRPRGVASPEAHYAAVGARYLTTFRHGAIEITVRDGEVWVDTFRTKEAIRLGPPSVRGLASLETRTLALRRLRDPC